MQTTSDSRQEVIARDKNLVYLTAGSIAGSAILVVASPVLTRMYSPEEFGIYTLYLSLLVPYVTVSGLGYNHAIPLAKNAKELINLIAITVGSSALLALILLSAHPLYFKYTYNGLDFGSVSALFAGNSIAVVAYTSFNNYLVARRKYRQLALSKTIKNITMIIIQLTVAYFGMKHYGLIIGNLISHASVVLFIAVFNFKEIKSIFSLSSYTNIVRPIRAYSKFPIFVMPAYFLHVLLGYVQPLLLAGVYDKYVIGNFGITRMVISVPVVVFGQSIGKLIAGEISKMIHDKSADTHELIKSMRIRILLFAVLPAIAGSLLAPTLFPVLFGKEWKLAGEMVLFMLPYTVSTLLSTPMQQVYILLEKHMHNMVYNILFLSASSLLVINHLYLNLNIYNNLLIYSTTCLVISIIYNYHINRLLLQYDRKVRSV